MEVGDSVNQVLEALRNSCLHFSAQETPYSLFITVRKKFTTNKNDPSPQKLNTKNKEEENCDLRKQFQKLENCLESLRNDLEKEIDDHADTTNERKNLMES